VIELFALLLFAHLLFDYPLQGDFLSRAKNRFDPIPHVPWYQAMFAHTAMHGMAVWIITGIPLLGLAEMAIHWITDDLKLRGELTFNQDQAIHIVCKVVWAVITVLVMVI
jgi:hypothetical protein